MTVNTIRNPQIGNGVKLMPQDYFSISMLAEFSIFPIGEGASLSKYVARSLRIVEESGLDYRINPMGTVIEGEWDEVMEVIKRCHHAIREDTARVSTSIKIDDRRGVKGALTRKIRSVEEKLGKTLRT